MSSFLNESPIQNQNKIDLNADNQAYSEEAKMTRKIEFDRGTPLNYDFPSNKVHTIPYTIKGFFKFTWKKIGNSPFNLCIIVIFLFYLIAYLIEMKAITQLKLFYSISFHISTLIIQFFVICIEYIRIYMNDLKINNQKARIYDTESRKFVEDSWKNIKVGNIICVKKDEVVPADIIILEALDHNHQCYLDYSSVNGIFDSFVTKRACQDTHAPVMKKILLGEYMKNIKGFLKYEEPNSNMHIFNGRLKLESFPRASDIKDDNFVMRGSTIKNIPLVYGLVVYTGMETKIMMTLKFTQSSNNHHSNDIPSKNHMLSSHKNQFNSVIIKRDREIIKVTLKFIQYILILIYFFFVVLLFLIELHKSYLCYYSFKNGYKKENDDHYYLDFYSIDKININNSKNSKTDPFYEMFLTVVQYALTMHFLFPFNWFGIMEIAYLILTKFIQWDETVLLKRKNKAEVINVNCLADFGQVRHILTDKTGTLTNRKFALKVCSIHGKLYSFDELERKDENYVFRIKDNDLKNLEIYQELHSNSKFAPNIKEFLENLLLCNSVKLYRTEINDNNNKNNNKVFASSYAEDKAMLKTFSKIGFKILNIKHNLITLDINGEKKLYQIIGLNKYTEDRNRMSILLRNEKDPGSMLLCKAKDLTIFSLIKKSNPQIDNEIAKTRYQIKELSKYGFRPFIFCKKNLTEEETNIFIEKFKTAENYVVKSEEHLKNLAIEYEQGMSLVGVLFFEEKIPKDLKYSITKLQNSGIKVWIASGDKRENVLSVGKNLNLYNPKSIRGDFSDKDKPEDLDIKMSMLLMQFLFPNDKINKMKTRKGVSVESNIKSSSKDLTILLSGGCFSRICSDQRNFQSLATLLSYCTSLLAYQFTPNNKYILCQMIRQYCSKNSKVLAVGDGFNDFTMLKEADLSIGIRSREILQVRNTCDVIVSKFSQIVNLILLHGTWNFWRLINIALTSFYAHFIITLPTFIHQNSNPYGSCFFLFSPGMITLMILTINLFIILVFCFDQPVERTLLSLNSNVYKENFYDSKKLILEFALDAIRGLADSLIIYFYFYKVDCINKEGETLDQEIFGVAIFCTLFSTVILKVYTLRLRSINIIQIFCGILTIVIIYGISYINSLHQNIVIQGFSYLVLFFNSMLVIAICFIYEYTAISLVIYFSDEEFLLKLTRMFMEFIHDNSFFKNYNGMYTYLAKEMPPLISKIDKISYPEVLEKINNNGHSLDPALENMADVSNEEVANLKIKKPFLRFYDKKLEIDYKQYITQGTPKYFLAYLIALFLFWLTDIAIEGINNQKVPVYLKLSYMILGLFFFIPYLMENFNRIFPFYLFLLLTFEIIGIYIDKDNNDTRICIQTFVILSFPLYFNSNSFSMMVLLSIYYCIGITPAIYLNEFAFKKETGNQYFLYSNLPLLYRRQVYTYGLVSMMVVFSYYNKLMSRIEFLKYYKSKVELKKDNLIMANLIPDFVRAKYNRRERGAVYGYETVTIVFCDLSDFDSLVAKLTPKDLITFLDELYSVMDQFCQLHGLQKIETVGKTYMAAGGIKECEIDVDPITLSTHPAIRSFEFSMDILDLVQKMILTSGDKIKVKIGIHTGKVIPAVVGEHKPQFSLIGDAVNTTARMCTNSKDNCVNCSEFSYEEIKQKYKDFTQSTKEVKGKGMMNLYLYDPSKNKKNIDSKMKSFGRDTSGNMIVKSISKNIPVLVKQGTKGSRGNNNNIIQPNEKNYNRNYDKISVENNMRNSIDSSMFIVENSKDLLINNNNTINNFLGHGEGEEFFNNYEEKRIRQHLVEKKNKEIPDVKNSFFNNSLLLFKFYDEVSKNGFIRFEKIRLQHSELKSIIINGILIAVLLFGLYMISQYAILSDEPIYLIIISNAIFLALLVGIVYKTNNLIHSYPETLPYLIMTIYLGLTITEQVAMNKIKEQFSLNFLVQQILIITALGNSGILNYFQFSYNLLLYIIIFSINCIINRNKHRIKKACIHLILLCFMNQSFMILTYYNQTINFLRNQEESKALNEKEKMLFNLMPLHVVQNMKDDIPVADVLDNVTLLFADIVRYTDFGNCHQPVEVVHMLMELFKRFDNATKECSVYKVHTIGDCYVVMGFNGKVSMNDRNYYEEAKNVCKMGECMIKIIREVRKKVNFEKLDMRIGIHTGPVIAGIIGSTVVRYDIFGSDVLIANKMESSGVPGRINISEDTKKLLESKELPYNLVLNKVVQIPSVGKEIKCYLIDKGDPDKVN